MRVISQNKGVNIPYEGTIFYVAGPYIYAQRNEYNHIIGEYKCSKDAISVMTEMLVAGADPFNNFYFQLEALIDEESCQPKMELHKE